MGMEEKRFTAEGAERKKSKTHHKGTKGTKTDTKGKSRKKIDFIFLSLFLCGFLCVLCAFVVSLRFLPLRALRALRGEFFPSSP